MHQARDKSRSLLAEKRFCFLGAGAMAEALIKGVLAEGMVACEQLWAVDISSDRTSWLRERYGVQAIEPAQAAEAISAADIMVLAVKPQQLMAAAGAYNRYLRQGQTLISILAGVTLGTLQAQLPHGLQVVRAMPNTSAAIGSSATAICAAPNTAEQALEWAEELFRSVGTVVRVAERDMDAVTALSGSGPAYIYAMAEAMQRGGVAAGLDEDTARQLTIQTMLGAAGMLQSTNEPAAELRRKVTSPGGTTMAGLQVLEHHHFADIMLEVILKAASRSRDLAEQSEVASS